MPNLATIYTDHTKIGDKSLETPKSDIPVSDEDAARHNARINWSRSTITAEFKNGLEEKIAKLLSESIAYAKSSPKENYDLIIQKLIRVDELNTLLHTIETLNK